MPVAISRASSPRTWTPWRWGRAVGRSSWRRRAGSTPSPASTAPARAPASSGPLPLRPGGGVDALARIYRTSEDTYELDTDPGFGEALAARLTRFKIRVDA